MRVSLRAGISVKRPLVSNFSRFLRVVLRRGFVVVVLLVLRSLAAMLRLRLKAGMFRAFSSSDISEG